MRNLAERRGAMLLLMAISLVGLMALLALAVDSGALQRQRRLAQAAADAGALAAATELWRGRPDLMVSSANSETSRNGFTDGSGGVTVLVNTAATSTNVLGGNAIKVTIQQSFPTIFAGLVGVNSVAMRTEAYSALGPGTVCLLVTEPTAPDALDVTSSLITAGTCGIAVNSSSANAVNLQSNGDLIGSTIAVVGPELKPADATGIWSSGVPPTADPLGYLHLLVSDTSAACNGAYNAYQTVTTATLSPGVYCGGITLDHQTVSFSAGLYVLKGGGFSLKHANATGTGVTFVNLNAPAAYGGSSNFCPFMFDVNSSATFSAMTTGSLANVLFYTDPGAPSVYIAPVSPYPASVCIIGSTKAGDPIVNSLGSNAVTTYTGSIYMPNQAIDLTSSADLTVNGGIVARTVAAKTGTGKITVAGVSGAGGSYALKKPTIVE